MERLASCEEQIFLTLLSIGGEAGTAEIREAANQKYGYDWKMQTVSTFLLRIEKKGYIRSQGNGRRVYRPTITLQEYRTEVLQETANRLFGGDWQQMKQFIESGGRDTKSRCDSRGEAVKPGVRRL